MNKPKDIRRSSQVSGLNILDIKIFYNLYISEKDVHFSDV